MITKEELDKMDACKGLLSEPAPEVVGKLIEEIRRLQEAPFEYFRKAVEWGIAPADTEVQESPTWDIRGGCDGLIDMVKKETARRNAELLETATGQIVGLRAIKGGEGVKVVLYTNTPNLEQPVCQPDAQPYLANPSPPANVGWQHDAPGEDNLGFVQETIKHLAFEAEIQERLKGEPRLPEFGFQRHPYQDVLEGVAGALVESTTTTLTEKEAMQWLIAALKPDGEAHLMFTTTELRGGRLCLVVYTKTKDGKTKYVLHEPICKDYLKKNLP